jgi:hypothetical protein
LSGSEIEGRIFQDRFFEGLVLKREVLGATSVCGGAEPKTAIALALPRTETAVMPERILC